MSDTLHPHWPLELNHFRTIFGNSLPSKVIGKVQWFGFVESFRKSRGNKINEEMLVIDAKNILCSLKTSKSNRKICRIIIFLNQSYFAVLWIKTYTIWKQNDPGYLKYLYSHVNMEYCKCSKVVQKAGWKMTHNWNFKIGMQEFRPEGRCHHTPS